MTETTTGDPRVAEDTGLLEQVRVPAWEAKYKLSDNPEELAQMVCCRDLDWRQAICGYVEEEPTLMTEVENLCTMCVETAAKMGAIMGSRQCPIDNQECPPEEEIDRMIAERASRT
jgi:hypothetical protein